MGVKVYDKASQSTIEVSSSEAEDGVLKGHFTVVDPTVQVAKGLNTGTVEAKDLAVAIGQGARIVDNEEAADLTIKREESDAGSMALGALEAAASGATLGVSTDLAVRLGLVDPRAAQARRDALGGAGTALEIAGAIAPGFVTGGGSAAVSGARTGAARALAYTPAAMATRAGRAAESAIGRSLGAGGAEAAAGGALARGARTLVPTAGGQFVEGLAFGAGAEIDDSVLGSRAFSVENVLAGGVLSAAIGGTTGILLPSVAKAAAGSAKVSADAVEGVVRRWTGDASTGGKPSMFSKAVATLSGSPRETVEQGFGLLKTPTGRRYAGMSKHEHAAEVAALGREIGSSVDAVNDAVTTAMKHTEGRNYMRGVTLPKNADLVAPRMTQAVVMKMDDRLKALGARAEKYQDANVRAIVDDARAIVAGGEHGLLEASGDAITVMRRADQIRSQLSALEQRARKANVQGFIADDMFTELKAVRRQMSEHLRDERVFGEAAKLQAAGDSLQSAALTARRGVPGKRTAAQRLLARDEVVTPEELVRIAQKYGRDGPGSMEESLDAVLRKEIDYLEWVAKHREGLPDEFQSAVATARAKHLELSKKVEANRERLQAQDIMNRLRAHESGDSVSIGIGSNMGASAGAAVGGGIGGMFGPLGAGVGVALGSGVGRAITSPYTTIRTLGALGHAADKAGVKLDNAVGRFLGKFRSSESAPTRVALTPGTVRRKGLVRRVAYEASIREATGRSRSDDRAIEARVRMLAQNPGTLTRELEPSLLDIAEHAPRYADEIAAQSERAVQFLASKIPNRYQSPFGPPSTVTNPVAEAKWQRYLTTAFDPGVVIDVMADGTITTEHVEALQAIWPERYKQIRDGVIEELARAQAEGRRVPFDARIQAGRLFGLVTDPGLEPKTLLAIQTGYHNDGVQDDMQAAEPGSRRRTTTREVDAPESMQRSPAEGTEV